MSASAADVSSSSSTTIDRSTDTIAAFVPATAATNALSMTSVVSKTSVTGCLTTRSLRPVPATDLLDRGLAADRAAVGRAFLLLVGTTSVHRATDAPTATPRARHASRTTPRARHASRATYM